MSLTMVQIGARLRELRHELGMSQQQAADVLGLHRPAVSEIEAGRRKVSTLELAAFSQLYATPIHEILRDNRKEQDTNG